MRRQNKCEPITGWVVVDKPGGSTSTAVVGKVRCLFKAAKAGHGGTLDPLATGILPVALGEATKVMRFVTRFDKTYQFTVRWGQETDTDDVMGKIISESNKRPHREEIVAALGSFDEVLAQIPPRYSAVWVQGRRAYDLARQGIDTELAPRSVQFMGGKVLSMVSADETEMEVTCGTGFYIRALARDLGRMLGTYGHVTALRRTRLGIFDESHSIPLDKLVALGHSETKTLDLVACLKPLSAVLVGVPTLTVSDGDAARLRQGQAVVLRSCDAPAQSGEVVAVVAGNPVALVDYECGEMKPSRVFNNAG
ncbi:MAG: tRNA pseudouridine(55) synthase TruB [Parvularculales bacterium]